MYVYVISHDPGSVPLQFPDPSTHNDFLSSIMLSILRSFQVFEGNSNSHSVKHTYLDQPIIARFIRFQTIHWNQHPSLRVEIIGCQGLSRFSRIQLWIPQYPPSALLEHSGHAGSHILPIAKAITYNYNMIQIINYIDLFFIY